MKQGLKSEPINVSQNIWYYEERKGISIVHRFATDNGSSISILTDIPWKRLLESVKRKYPKLKESK